MMWGYPHCNGEEEIDNTCRGRGEGGVVLVAA